MPKWTFKRVRVNGSELRLVPLPPALRAKQDRMEQLIAEASRAKPCANPVYSGFYVCGAIAAEGDIILPAANKEYGRKQALHCEEDAGAALVSHFKSVERVRAAKVMLAFSCGEAPKGVYPLPTSCGNCRDFMRSILAPETLIISGAANGLATVAELKDLLYTNLDSVPRRSWKTMLPDSLVDAIAAEGTRLEYNPYPNRKQFPARKYAAMITTQHGGKTAQYYGAFANGADFHPLYAMEDAFRAAQRAGDPYVETAVIVAEGDGSEPPDVMYRDRQRLMEAALDCEVLTGRVCNPEILLATYRNSSVTGAWTARSSDWLPVPFSPAEFGPDFLKGHKTYLEQKYGAPE